MSNKANAEPTKDFFVRMITRDIALEDSILDLLDNSVDGATRQLVDKDPDTRSFSGFRAAISFDKDSFCIEDNCGGISLDDAVNYAFRFGRRRDAPSDAEFGIGLYGIGMKRAIFKLGNVIAVQSRSGEDSFIVPIDVQKWTTDPVWDFDLEPGSKQADIGTKIEVRELHKSIADEFGDNVFENKLRKIVARDYSFILQDGFEIQINKKKVEPHAYELRQSDEFRPLKTKYLDDGVEVEIIAGLAGVLPEDISPERMDRRGVEYYGWFVACNERIVIAASKSEDTVWGSDGFTKWHPQYNGFMGIVNFNSSDPGRLPWTTTKREIDTQSPVYKRAVARMKAATRVFTDYSNERKADIRGAKEKECSTNLIKVSELESQRELKLPKVVENKVKMANISYAIELDRAKKAAKALGKPNMAYKQIGLKTFEYYMDVEVGDDNA